MERNMTPGRLATRRRPPAGRRQSFRGSRLGARGLSAAARSPRCSARGFTLIEILIVITIIGILITLAQPNFNRAVTAAKEATLKENLFILRDVIDQFSADNAKYPASLNDLVEKGYIRQVPKDPVTGSADTWVLVPGMDAQGQPAGVYDVRSGSDRTARDGSQYADW
jgi:general secretion pathway protein G